MAKRAVKLFGTEVPDAKGRRLAAGPLTAMLSNGALRYIRWHGAEVLRGIAYLVRDKNWGTYGPAIEGLKVREGKTGFSVSYTATCKDAEQAIRYEAKIEAKADGSLVFSAIGTPLGDFLTNRTGFVVLHPLVGVVGKPLEIVHTDGKRERSKFPAVISPGQPFFEVRSLKHTVAPGVTATVLMEGNKYEMEDHRNWMDASYKTYVCSLLDPWPYTLKKNEPFTQSIAVKIAGKPKAAKTSRATKAIAIEVGKTQGTLPIVGTGVPMAEAEAARDRSDLISAAGLKHLVAQIDGRRDRQAEAAAAFRDLKSETGAKLSLEIVLPAKEPADREMRAIADEVRRGGLKPDAVIVTQMHDLKSFQPNTPRPWGPSYEEMAKAARAAFPGVPVGGGMLSYFTELNRKPPPKGVFDFITHTVCPIVHAADDISVMETLESIPSIVASTRAMIGKAPYHVGPSAIPCRDNPYGAAVAPNPGKGRVCLSDFDPRQRGLFGAAWTLGLIARFAEGGVDAVAAGAATGPSGMIEGARVFPVYRVIAGLAPLGRAKRLAAVSSAPSTVIALAHAGPALWLANLTGEKQSVRVSGLTGKATLSLIDDSNVDLATLKKVGALDLGAYAVARIAAA